MVPRPLPCMESATAKAISARSSPVLNIDSATGDCLLGSARRHECSRGSGAFIRRRRKRRALAGTSGSGRLSGMPSACARRSDPVSAVALCRCSFLALLGQCLQGKECLSSFWQRGRKRSVEESVRS